MFSKLETDEEQKKMSTPIFQNITHQVYFSVSSSAF